MYLGKKYKSLRNLGLTKSSRGRDPADLSSSRNFEKNYKSRACSKLELQSKLKRMHPLKLYKWFMTYEMTRGVYSKLELQSKLKRMHPLKLYKWFMTYEFAHYTRRLSFQKICLGFVAQNRPHRLCEREGFEINTSPKKFSDLENLLRVCE